jgi:hypothetical protein
VSVSGVRAVPDVEVSVSAACWTLGRAFDPSGTLELVGAKATP